MNTTETRKITLELTELEARLLSTALHHRVRGYSVEYSRYELPAELNHDSLRDFITSIADFQARYPSILNLRFDP